MATGAGSVELDFGVAPGGTVATATVTGQASILATDHVGAWFMAEASTDHSAETHRYILPNFVGLVANAPTAATGFTITATSLIDLVGKIKCRWGWSS
jgi:hypothetical protein